MAKKVDSFRAGSAVIGVVFDGDDTLWSTEQLYDDARSRAAHIVAETGLDSATWEQRERRIDVSNVHQFGYSVERFPTSCIQAYEELCSATGRAVEARIVARIRREATSVFRRRAPVVTGARKTLLFLRARGARLALLTKGNPEVQARRVEQSGLRDLFDVIKIVPEKSPAVIRDIVTALGTSARSTWMVGNSMRSDVVPAIHAGLRAVWIDAHVWEYERDHDLPKTDAVITAIQIADIPSLITT